MRDALFECRAECVDGRVRRRLWVTLVTCCLLLCQGQRLQAATNYTLIGWNDLGMHCMDGTDFSMFSILPPFNTFHAQLIHEGNLVTNPAGLTLTYEAIADPDGSINTTAADKINFWEYVEDHFGAVLPPDVGLAGMAMPGVSNTPQPMTYESAHEWFTAEGVPISPIDDAGRTNAYPMMRLSVRDASSNLLAYTDIVLPVSDEMDCSACHQSGSAADAIPQGGWSWHCEPDRDMRYNILRLHDQKQSTNSVYATALAAQGYHPDGLYPTVVQQGTSILCARCHRSNALPGLGQPGISPFTTAMHMGHADALDPVTAQPLDAAVSRESCYRCHPGAKTLCLRGAMGTSVAVDGLPAMSCQSCHGSMTQVGASSREGWFEEPNCQACHTGTATDNDGQIRYDSAFVSPGVMRVPTNQTFATNPDTPAAGVSLYRFSTGHGGLQCSACHGSPHATYPTARQNDNIQSIQLQGHKGIVMECSTCHESIPTDYTGGPHGMHPVGVEWVNGGDGDHGEAASNGGRTQCQACHGADYRGTVLSRSHADRTISTGKYGTKNFWRGFQIGCYNCHNGANSDNSNNNSPAQVQNLSTSTFANTSVSFPLLASDSNGDSLTLRIVSHTQHGMIALTGTQATYLPGPNFIGTDTFTYAAWDGDTDSNLATGTISVAEGLCVLSSAAAVPATASVLVAVPFWSEASLDNCDGSISYDWDFGDGSAHDAVFDTCHAFSATGSYTWVLRSTANGITTTNTGVLEITDAIVDTDLDGISDGWEQQNFTNLTTATLVSDFDHDSFIDLHEYLAGTGVKDSTSYLKITDLNVESGGDVVLSWASATNKFYTIARSDNLGPGIFNPLDTGIPATPPMNTYTDVTAVAEWLSSYRIEVE